MGGSQPGRCWLCGSDELRGGHHYGPRLTALVNVKAAIFPTGFRSRATIGAFQSRLNFTSEPTRCEQGELDRRQFTNPGTPMWRRKRRKFRALQHPRAVGHGPCSRTSQCAAAKACLKLLQ